MGGGRQAECLAEGMRHFSLDFRFHLYLIHHIFFYIIGVIQSYVESFPVNERTCDSFDFVSACRHTFFLFVLIIILTFSS